MSGSGLRHEGAAAFACSGYAKASGLPAACLTIAGPGATNLLTGLWDCKVDRAPALALTGQVDVQLRGPRIDFVKRRDQIVVQCDVTIASPHPGNWDLAVIETEFPR